MLSANGKRDKLSRLSLFFEQISRAGNSDGPFSERLPHPSVVGLRSTLVLALPRLGGGTVPARPRDVLKRPARVANEKFM